MGAASCAALVVALCVPASAQCPRRCGPEARRSLEGCCLRRGTGSLYAGSDDVPGQVFVDGEDRGPTPVRVDDLRPGRHVVEIRRPYRPVHQQVVEVPAGALVLVVAPAAAAPAAAPAEVPPDPAATARVEVHNPGDVEREVIADGRPIGTVGPGESRTFALAPGPHTLVAVASAGAAPPVQRVTTLEEGRTLEWHLASPPPAAATPAASVESAPAPGAQAPAAASPPPSTRRRSRGGERERRYDQFFAVGGLLALGVTVPPAELAWGAGAYFVIGLPGLPILLAIRSHETSYLVKVGGESRRFHYNGGLATLALCPLTLARRALWIGGCGGIEPGWADVSVDGERAGSVGLALPTVLVQLHVRIGIFSVGLRASLGFGFGQGAVEWPAGSGSSNDGTWLLLQGSLVLGFDFADG